jgi:hypothetical protein
MAHGKLSDEVIGSLETARTQSVHSNHKKAGHTASDAQSRAFNLPHTFVARSNCKIAGSGRVQSQHSKTLKAALVSCIVAPSTLSTPPKVYSRLLNNTMLARRRANEDVDSREEQSRASSPVVPHAMRQTLVLARRCCECGACQWPAKSPANRTEMSSVAVACCVPGFGAA